jgi:hypothetical protein
MTRPIETKVEASGLEAPERWLARDAGGDATEDRLAALIRAGAPPEGLAPGARARVWSRLGDAATPWRSLAGLRWAAAGIVLFASAGVVARVTARRWWPQASSTAAPAASPAKATPRRAHGSRSDEARVAAAPLPAALEPSPPVSAVTSVLPAERGAPSPALAVASPAPHGQASAPRAARAVETAAREPAPSAPAEDSTVAASPAAASPVAPPPEPAPIAAPASVAAAAPVAAAPSTLASETPLLGAALTHLRQQRDAPGALAALDAYDARFPRGTLRREADGARVDALLLLGREGDALVVLRRLSLEPRGRDQELRVIRGELTAPSSCTAAVDDFERVLAEAPPAALAERALHGRATCRARLGDDAAAARDFREYLRRFPEGPFAGEARRALGENNL